MKLDGQKMVIGFRFSGGKVEKEGKGFYFRTVKVFQLSSPPGCLECELRHPLRHCCRTLWVPLVVGPPERRLFAGLGPVLGPGAAPRFACARAFMRAACGAFVPEHDPKVGVACRNAA